VFQVKISKELDKYLRKIKNRPLKSATIKKMKEIISQDKKTINNYKNLRHNLSNFKRVHILKSFVLLFKVDYEKKIIYFHELNHHDKVYKK